jgi:hypothetical protein
MYSYGSADRVTQIAIFYEANSSGLKESFIGLLKDAVREFNFKFKPPLLYEIRSNRFSEWNDKAVEVSK